MTDDDRSDLAGKPMRRASWFAPQRPVSGGTVKLDDADSPEDGHTFELTFRIRGSSKVVGDPVHHDAPEFDDPVSVRVRAWNLRDALAAAGKLSLDAWGWPDEDAGQVGGTEWGTRLPNGQVIAVDTETHARAVRSLTTVRREVGPWTEDAS